MGQPLRVVTAYRAKTYIEQGRVVGQGHEAVGELTIDPDQMNMFVNQYKRPVVALP